MKSLKSLESLKSLLTLLCAELKRSWAMIKAYPLNEAGSVVILAFLFYMLLLGAKYLAGAGTQLGDRPDTMFVGYVAWLLMFTNYQSVSGSIREESTQGTLMQLLTSPFSSRAILFLRAMAASVSDVVTITLVAGVIMLVTGIRVHVSMAVLPFVLTALLAATGLGFILGSITLLYKKADMLLSIAQYLILLAVIAPIEHWGVAGKILSVFVPAGPSAAGLRTVMVGNHFSPLFLGIAVANVLLYLGGGLLLFGRAERLAKQRGLLGAF
jgi:ABC-2 type transport system permease protein